jgi:hypothetical protein
MRYVLFSLPLAALAVASLYFFGVGVAGPATAQQAITVQMGPSEGPDGGGNQTGTATLTPMNGQTEVVVNIDPSPDGAEVEQPAHIHAGTCADLGAVEYPLDNVVNGQSTTVVDVSLDALQAGTFAINVHGDLENVGVYVSCGDIPAAEAEPTPTPAPDATPTPAAPPTTGGPPAAGGAPLLAYLLLAAGAVAIVGGGTLVLRLRR